MEVTQCADKQAEQESVKIERKDSNLSTSVLFARLKGLTFDVAALQRFFTEKVATVPSVLYRDTNVDYDGWAVTSRDGAIDDNIRRKDNSIKQRNGRKLHRLAGASPFHSNVPTPLYDGAVKDAMTAIEKFGITGFRARFLRLQSASYNMRFHLDTLKKRETWRLHIPIFTSPESLFQWRADDGEVTQVHLPADGSAYLVRVDLAHRAVYNIFSPNLTGRVHLVMGVKDPPRLDQIEPMILARTREPCGKFNGLILDHTLWLDDDARRGVNDDVSRSEIGPGSAPVIYRPNRAPSETVNASIGRRKSHVLVDRDSGRTLRASSSTSLFHPAGLTKLMVLYETFDALRRGELDFESMIEIPKSEPKKSHRAIFRPGELIDVKKAVQALVQRQTNSAALAIASKLLGDEANFAAHLTQVATRIGMCHTRFLNVTGVHHPKQVSTPCDIVTMCRALISEFPEYLHFFSESEFTHDNRRYENRNLLLGRCEGVDGLLTARNRISGHHAAVTAQRGGRGVVAVVTGADDAEAAAKRIAELLSQGFGMYYDKRKSASAGQ